MKTILLIVVICLMAACSADHTTTGALSGGSPARTPHCYANGFIADRACAYKFDELFELNRTARKGDRIGIWVGGVLKQSGSVYYFYKNLSAAKRGEIAQAIKVDAIHDPAIEDKRVLDKLVGRNVVIVGYFRRNDETNGSLDVYSVRWYSKWQELYEPSEVVN